MVSASICKRDERTCQKGISFFFMKLPTHWKMHKSWVGLHKADKQRSPPPLSSVCLIFVTCKMSLIHYATIWQPSETELKNEAITVQKEDEQMWEEIIKAKSTAGQGSGRGSIHQGHTGEWKAIRSKRDNRLAQRGQQIANNWSYWPL